MISNRDCTAGFALLVWTLLNTFQAAFSPLLADEMYYAVWSQKLSLYYFDHPPLVAWSIRAGTLLFPGALGVRLIALFYHTATLMLAWRITGSGRAFVHFLLLGAASLMFHASGFLAVPDSPYLFGCMLFLFFCRKFLRHPTPASGIGLGCAAALTVASKYHGWLFLGLCLVPNARFFLSHFRSLVPAFLAFAALIFPVYYEAAQHGFETLRLHLGGRQMIHRFPKFTLDFVAGWLAGTGIWLYPIGLWAVRKQQVSDRFQKSLLSLAVGFPAAILALSLISSVEANWAAPALPALLLLMSRNGPDMRKPFLLTALAPLWLAGLGIRLLLMVSPDILQTWRPVDFTRPEAWVKPVEKAAGRLPVVFLNSYQLAAAYTLHSGKPAFSLNNFNYRRNQYDLWQWDTAFWGKPVYFVSAWPFPNLEKLTDSPYALYGAVIDSLFVLPQIKISWIGKNSAFKKGSEESVLLECLNTYSKTVPEMFNQSDIQILVTFRKEGRRLDEYEQYLPLDPDFFPIKSGEKRRFTRKVRMPATEGRYHIHFSLRQGWLETGYNSPFYSFRAL